MILRVSKLLTVFYHCESKSIFNLTISPTDAGGLICVGYVTILLTTYSVAATKGRIFFTDMYSAGSFFCLTTGVRHVAAGEVLT